ncbi:F-box/LRR-repeat protein 3 [Phalaenopsis equestris]|uniref:F-box/LRR-repeat protein 3 n=1 Tax=Phalaenopsis equestris TaxID=78828 RepID=UPI0009E4EA89|nr:F-box/LRR-repeat protein 3 [Phalaenopsis equestris]
MKCSHPPSLPKPITAILSVDLLVRILDHIVDAGDRKSFRLVCDHFLLAESLHRRSLRPLRLKYLPSLLGRRYPSIESLDLSVCHSLDDNSLATAIASGSYWQKLRRVGLARASGVGWKGIEALVTTCPLIEAIDLSHCCEVGDRVAAALAKAAGLRDLRIDKCLGVTDVGLAMVSVGCGRLERLGIKWCMEISDIGIDLLVKKCRNLRVLDLSYLQVTNNSLRAISSLEKFEALSLVGCRFIDDEGLAFLNNGRNSLQSIDISRCQNVTWFGIASVIEGHRNLQIINMGDCHTEVTPAFLSQLSLIKTTLNILKLDGLQISDSGLQNIGSNCNNLIEIGLSKCLGVTDKGIGELVSSCTCLRSIDLTCCHLLTDNVLTAISKYCINLTCLRLEACSLMTEKGFGQIATGCSQLLEIDLTDCSINDIALQHLTKCSELKVLKLGLCANITSKGLAYIGSNCNNLEELDLYRCVEVDDYGLSFLADGCKRLKKLNLCYCIQITNQGLQYLSSLEWLSDLELRGLVNVSSMGITSIAFGCKSLVELDLKGCSSIDDAAMFALARYSLNLRQINISNCSVSGVGLCKLLRTLKCLQDAKLVQLTRTSVEGFEFALRASRCKLKKLKLAGDLMELLSPKLLQMLQARGCRIRWVDKPMLFNSLTIE